MAYIEPEKEKEIREALKARAQKPNVLGSGFPTFTRRVYVSSESDLIKKIGVKVGKITEYKYLQIELVGIDDIEGEDNCPGLELIYRFHLFVGFIDSRPNGATFANSTDEFNANLINLRNEFSLSDTILEDNSHTSNDALTRDDFILIDDDPLTGAVGHFIDQTTRVEVF